MMELDTILASIGLLGSGAGAVEYSVRRQQLRVLDSIPRHVRSAYEQTVGPFSIWTVPRQVHEIEHLLDVYRLDGVIPPTWSKPI